MSVGQTPQSRTPTSPGWGATRDGFATALVALAATAVAGWVTSTTGNPAAGEVAAQGVHVYGPVALTLLSGGAAALVTGIGKVVRDRMHAGSAS